MYLLVALVSEALIHPVSVLFLFFFIGSLLYKKRFLSPGLLPWNAVPGKACGMTLSNVCKTREVSDACRQNVILFLIVNPQRISLKGLPEIVLTSNVSAYSSDLVNPVFFLLHSFS